MPLLACLMIHRLDITTDSSFNETSSAGLLEIETTRMQVFEGTYVTMPGFNHRQGHHAMSPIDYMHSSDLLPCLHYKRPSYIFLPEAADNGNPTSGCSNSPPNSPSQSTCITPHHAALQPSCLKHVLGHINRQT